MEEDSAQDTGDREKEQASQDLTLIPDLTPNPEISLVRTFRGEGANSNPTGVEVTEVISPEGEWILTRNGTTSRQLAPVSQRITSNGSRMPGMTTSKQQQWRRVLDPRSTSPGISPGTNNSNTLDLKENPTEISSNLEKATREKEEEKGETQIRNMITGTHKRGTIPESM